MKAQQDSGTYHMVHLVAFALEEERIEHQDTPTGLMECAGFGALKTGRRNGTRGTI